MVLLDLQKLGKFLGQCCTQAPSLFYCEKVVMCKIKCALLVDLLEDTQDAALFFSLFLYVFFYPLFG